MIRHICPACEGVLYSSSAAIGLPIRCEYCRFGVEVPTESQSGPYRGFRPVRPTPRRAIARLPSLGVVLWLAVIAAVSAAVIYSFWPVDQASIRLSRAVKTRDGGCVIRVPASWIERRGFEQDDLLVRPRQEDMCVKVLSEAKVVSGQAMTLEKYARLVCDGLKAKLKDATISTAKALTLDDRPALQYELGGEVEGISTVLLLTLIEGRHHFHQIAAITTRATAAKNRPLLERITQTFREGS